MTDDLVTRLRAWNGPYYADAKKALNEAADEIERLRAKVALLSERLPEDARILDVCAGLDADTVEAALRDRRDLWPLQANPLADWKPRAER